MGEIAGARLRAAREARKRAEYDVQLLKNRIALLKCEEAKAWRKINELRRRTQETIEHRSKQVDHFREKDALRQECDDERESMRRHNASLRARAHSERARAAAHLASARRRSASTQREQIAQRKLALDQSRTEEATSRRVVVQQ